MPTNNVMSKPKTGAAPKTADASCMTPAEYFQTKLNCEMTPYALNEKISKKMTDCCIVDVRSAEDYAEGHIPTAINIPLSAMEEKMSMLPKDKMMVMYGSGMSCQMAPRACLMLAQKGCKVMELCGGMESWKQLGYAVERCC